MATRIAITLMGKHKPIYDQASCVYHSLYHSLLHRCRPLSSSRRLTFDLRLLLSALADDCGDYVVVTNARAVTVTGRKAEQKLYRSHSGFPGGLKEVPYARMMEDKPEEVRSCLLLDHAFAVVRSALKLIETSFTTAQIIRRAVSGMLPKNRLRAKRLERLFIFPEATHPYEANLLKDHAAEFGKTWKKEKEGTTAAAPTPATSEA